MKNQWLTTVQFPLHHAAARTIHVAQSATYENIYIDMLPNSRTPTKWWKQAFCCTLQSHLFKWTAYQITKCEELSSVS